MAELRLRLGWKGYNATFDWRLAVNTPQPGWRGWLGLKLRLLAQRIDGCHSLGVHIHTEPAIGPQAERQVMQIGILAMQRGAHDLVREAAVDQALRKVYPDLVDR